jgi:septal ring factor EnvC (AmiA/AmiB activator)
MKAWMAALVLVLAPLAACGPSKELEQAQADTEALRKENAKLKTKINELEGSLQQVRQERDQLKVAAAKPAAAPAPTPAPALAPAKKPGTTVRK